MPEKLTSGWIKAVRATAATTETRIFGEDKWDEALEWENK